MVQSEPRSVWDPSSIPSRSLAALVFPQLYLSLQRRIAATVQAVHEDKGDESQNPVCMIIVKPDLSLSSLNAGSLEKAYRFLRCLSFVQPFHRSIFFRWKCYRIFWPMLEV